MQLYLFVDELLLSNTEEMLNLGQGIGCGQKNI